MKSSNFVALTCTPEVAPSVLTVALRGNGEPTFGMSYTLTCDFLGGNGNPTYVWRRNTGILPTQSPEMFSISSLRPADSGVYTCTVTRGSMTATSNGVGIAVIG